MSAAGRDHGKRRWTPGGGRLQGPASARRDVSARVDAHSLGCGLDREGVRSPARSGRKIRNGSRSLGARPGYGDSAAHSHLDQPHVPASLAPCLSGQVTRKWRVLWGHVSSRERGAVHRYRGLGHPQSKASSTMKDARRPEALGARGHIQAQLCSSTKREWPRARGRSGGGSPECPPLPLIQPQGQSCGWGREALRTTPGCRASHGQTAGARLPPGGGGASSRRAPLGARHPGLWRAVYPSSHCDKCVTNLDHLLRSAAYETFDM